MLSRRTLNSTPVAVSVLMLAACGDLAPDRSQPPLDAAAQVDSPRADEGKPQAPPPRPPPAPRRPPPERQEVTGVVADVAFDQIRRSLRALVVAEQGFFAETGIYTEELSRLGFRPAGESQVAFLWLTRKGWAARGTHPAMPGRDCVTFVGAASEAPATQRFRRRGGVGVIVCDVPSEARAAPGRLPPQPPAEARPAVPDTGSALDAVAPIVQLKVDLRNLVQAQTAYHGTQGLYTRRIEQLQLQFAWHRGVRVTLLHADERSWSARATHTARPGKSCVVWDGSPAIHPATQAQRKVSEDPGVPVCDD